MKAAATITIIGLLAVIAGLLAWPSIHEARVRSSLGYRTECGTADLLATLGKPAEADACHERRDRKYGIR